MGNYAKNATDESYIVSFEGKKKVTNN